MKKSTKVVIGVIVALIVICGGFYYYASHAVASHVPGHVYEYTSVSGNQKAYMTFSQTGDEVVVTPSKEKALQASNSASDFDKVYKQQAKEGKWNYKADGSKLTISKIQNKQVSLWQYNNVLVLGKKMRSSSFTYQIINAGQGIDKKATNFEQIK